MLSFNIDYLTNHLAKNRPRTERTHTMIVSHIVAIIKLVQKKTQANHLRTAFLSILAKPRTKLQKLEIIQPMIKRRLQSGFLKIKRFILLPRKDEVIKRQKKYDYPVSIVQKVFKLKKMEVIQFGFRRLLLNKRNKVRQQQILGKIEEFATQYIHRNIYLKAFRAIELLSTKHSQYTRHLKYFQYIFESARMRALFNAFSTLSIKMYQKNLAEIEKQKLQKKDLANKSVSKRNEVINQLKRKLNNMKGQVSQGQINNNKRRTDGLRQNGAKLIKKNEEMRIYQINTSYLQYDLFSLERELVRKQDFVNNRAGNTMQFQQLRSIYAYISSLDVEKNGKLIFSKFIPINKQRQIENKHTFIVTQNTKLKYLVSLYERIQQTKKTDSYNNSQIENSSLKMVISSLFKTQFMEPQKDAMMKSCNEIQAKILILMQERQNLKKL